MTHTRKNLARAALASILGLLMVVGVAVDNAFAYVSRSCTLYLTARLSATAWQTSSTNTRLHLDLNPYYGSPYSYYSYRILVDGIALKNSAGSYVVNDIYINRGANTSHTVQGQWIRNPGGGVLACSVTIPSYPGY